MSMGDMKNGIPREWELRSLAEACLLLTDGSHFSPSTIAVGYPYITVRDINGSKIDFVNCKFVSKESFDELSKNGCQPLRGDVLFSKDGTVGKVALVEDDREFVVLSSLAIMRPKNEVLHSKFLKWALQSPAVLESALGMKSGTALRRVVLRSLKTLQLPIPPLNEQDEIVRILEEQFSRLDAAAASIAAVRRKADQFRRSLIESCIFGHLSEHFADAWEFKSLDELVDKKSDIVDGPFGSNLKSEHYVASGARVIRLQNIGYGDFRDDAAFISLERFGLLQKHSVQAGDLLFASLGENLPRTCLVPQLDTPAIVKADCIRVRLSTTVCSRYVLMATQSPTARTWAAEQLHGLGRPRLGLGNIRQFPVRIPPIDAQHRIVDFLDSQLEGVVRLEEESVGFLNHISGLRKAILHAAFNGELTKEWRGKNNG